jgi:hypothetical protein
MYVPKVVLCDSKNVSSNYRESLSMNDTNHLTFTWLIGSVSMIFINVTKKYNPYFVSKLFIPEQETKMRLSKITKTLISIVYP